MAEIDHPEFLLTEFELDQFALALKLAAEVEDMREVRKLLEGLRKLVVGRVLDKIVSEELRPGGILAGILDTSAKNIGGTPGSEDKIYFTGNRVPESKQGYYQNPDNPYGEIILPIKDQITIRTPATGQPYDSSLSPEELARAPQAIDPETGQYKDHWVLSNDDRAANRVRPYRDTYIHSCGFATKMGSKIAETYAVNHKFYSKTFCVGCKDYFPVDQFVWEGTDEKVGS